MPHLGWKIDNWNQLLVHNENKVGGIGYMVLPYPTTTNPSNWYPHFPHVPLGDMKDKFKRHLDFDEFDISGKEKNFG